MEENNNLPCRIERQVIIYKRILDGHSRFDVLSWLKKDFDLTESAANTEYYNARSIMAENSKEDIESLTSEYVNKYGDLYKKCVDAGNYRDAKTVLDSLCKIQGIDKSITIAANFKVEWQ